MEADFEVTTAMGDQESMSWLLNKIEALSVINDLDLEKQ
jgi:hypothetical protein